MVDSTDLIGETELAESVKVIEEIELVLTAEVV